MYVTPRQLAYALGVSAAAVREFCRERFPQHVHKTSWRLDAKSVCVVVQHFVRDA